MTDWDAWESHFKKANIVFFLIDIPCFIVIFFGFILLIPFENLLGAGLIGLGIISLIISTCYILGDEPPSDSLYGAGY